MRRIVPYIVAGAALSILSIGSAAPPKSSASKKKPSAPAQEEKAESADADAESAVKKSKATGEEDEDGEPKKIIKTDAEWKRILTRRQFEVARMKETDPPFSGAYWRVTKKDGIYHCVCCGQPLFDSRTKFDSGTGWPSFFDPVNKKAVAFLPDTSESIIRMEVQCSRCDAHLGHVFEDGPAPTGLRFCMNSTSLKFVARGSEKGAKSKSAKDSKEPKGKE